jgi:hypothetical protein
LSTVAVSTLVPALNVRSTTFPVLQRGAHEGAALAGLDVLELDDGPQLPVQVEHESVLQVVRGGHAGVLRILQRTEGTC